MAELHYVPNHLGRLEAIDIAHEIGVELFIRYTRGSTIFQTIDGVGLIQPELPVARRLIGCDRGLPLPPAVYRIPGHRAQRSICGRRQSRASKKCAEGASSNPRVFGKCRYRLAAGKRAISRE